MELTHKQRIELKKIDRDFQHILQYSEDCGIQIDDLYKLMTFPIFEFATENRVDALNLAMNRQRVFEQSKVASPGKNSHDVSF